MPRSIEVSHLRAEVEKAKGQVLVGKILFTLFCLGLLGCAVVGILYGFDSEIFFAAGSAATPLGQMAFMFILSAASFIFIKLRNIRINHIISRINKLISKEEHN